VDALTQFGEDALSHEEKDEERDYILSRTSYPPEGQRRILDYCWTDVDGTRLLLPHMLPDIDLDQALYRGAYTKPVAWMEHNGLPISPLYRLVEGHRKELQYTIALSVEEKHDYGVFAFEGKLRKPVFKQRNFEALIERLGLMKTWRKTANGQCSTEDERVFEPMAKLHPELEPLRQARKSIKTLSLIGTKLGADGRNRAGVWPFGQITGRNSPKASEFILNRPHWVRNFIAPTEGRALVHADIIAAEAGIAADASGDPELIRIYQSGADQYIEFAKSAEALPPDAVRDKLNNPEVELVRGIYKTALLGIQYGIGAETLSINLGVPFWKADRIIASHKRTYATYWAWADAQIRKARRLGYTCTEFGWTLATGPDTSRNTLLNFPQQSACAELLRLTCILLEERGLGVMLCAPHHDALYLECSEEQAQFVAEELQRCFKEAAEVVLSGRVQLRLDVGIVRFPDHYEDKDGKEIWDIVMKFLDEQANE
jgi:DNA polymerase I-like protein with 3'-5' exonuclease and polymerase domains